jgi:hypothetical protein
MGGKEGRMDRWMGRGEGNSNMKESVKIDLASKNFCDKYRYYLCK